MAFRIVSFDLNKHMFKNSKIKLFNGNPNDEQNYFSLIIGNNGTGKSTILGEIADGVSSRNKPKLDLFADLIGKPSRTIVVSNSPFDKFPMDKTYNAKYSYKSKYLYKDMDYYYIGYRGHSISKKNRVDKVIEVLLNNYTHTKYNRKIREILSFLGYEARISVDFWICLKKIHNYHMRKEK